MNPPITISTAEWDVMRVLWDGSPLSASSVIERLGHRDWHPRTVKTLLARLVKKGVLGFEEAGRLYRYHPLVDRASCVRAESRSVLGRVADAAPALLVNLVDEVELSDDEIAELRALLDRKERKA
jgi:BlaI family penicillinase repressor